jgi:hypothetical protein
MKLVVPYLAEVHPVDQRLIRLAEFLGIDCMTVSLDKSTGASPGFLERAVANGDSCFVVNPCVLQNWVGGETLPTALGTFLVAHFSHLLVHSPRPTKFDNSLIFSLSCGSLKALQKVRQSGNTYDISPSSRDVCDAFSGLSFGPTNDVNDQVFSAGNDGLGLRTLVSVDGQPFMATLRNGGTQVWLLAGADIADLDAVVGYGRPVSEYFSRLLPHSMALRSIFAEKSWRPSKRYASVIIDDPLLRKNYGFLNFDSLLTLTNQHNFHSTIAFIPHNFKRNSPEITQMFRLNPERFSLSFHGNDHTGAEFASKDISLLNTLLRTAEERMKQHNRITDLHCDRVMVFPQGNFSREGMAVLKAHNFDGAVNTTPHPLGEKFELTLRDLAQPAVLRYENFPLFLRKNSIRTQAEDIAFNCFFGRPVLIVEHHDIFQHPETLVDAVTRINTVAPDICWSGLGPILKSSILERSTSDGVHHIRAYSNLVQVSNHSSSSKEFSIEWNHRSRPEQVVQTDRTPVEFSADEMGVRASTSVPSGSSRTLSLIYQNPYHESADLGMSSRTKAFVRRRLSEVRDNYLSKNPRILAAAKRLQHSFPR